MREPMQNRFGRWLAVALLGLFAVSPGVRSDGSSAGRPGLELGALLGGDAEADAGYAVADAPRVFDFPADHGPHPDFRSEWWYLVVHLRDAEGERFGVQFTLFRQALAPPRSAAEAHAAGESGVDPDVSQWRTRQVWMAHMALTDPMAGHQASERFARGALGLAGAEAEPFAAWLEDWRLAAEGGDGMFPLRLRARVTDVPEPFEVDLRLTDGRGPVLQGEDGLSQKSAREGNASYYYSFTRMNAVGTIRVQGREVEVEGLGWIDREWSTSALDPGQVGWDWFALHLDDGRDLMIYRIRRDDGSVDPASAGVLVEADGSSRRLTPDDWALRPEGHWTDETGARWPVRWRLEIPLAGIDGRVEARRQDQLNRLSVRYWEGQVCLDGPVPACGYLEMTGY